MESGQFWLSEMPEEEYSKSWDSALPRVAIWTILREKAGNGMEFVLPILILITADRRHVVNPRD